LKTKPLLLTKQRLFATSKKHPDGHLVFPVVFGLVLPVVLVPFVGTVVFIRQEIDQHYLGIREIIPQQEVGNPARCG